MRTTLPNILALLAVGAIWGLTPAMAKLAIAGGMRPLGITAVTASVGALLLLGLAALRREAPRFDAPHLKHYAAGGVIGLALANLVAFTGLSRAPAGLFALLLPLSGLLSVWLFAAAGIERATPRRVLGACLGMAGVALAMAPGAALPDPALLPFAALMLLTPLCYALANLLSVKLAVRGTGPLPQAAGTMALAAAAALPLALLFGHLGAPASAGVAVLVVAQGVLTGIAYLLYFVLLVRAGGVFTSQVAYVTTLMGLSWAYLLFGEVPGWLTVPAAALIFGGLALVTLERR